MKTAQPSRTASTKKGLTSGWSAGMRKMVRHLVNCNIVAVARSSDTSVIDVPLISDVLSRLGFRVYCADLAGVSCMEDVAVRLSRTIKEEETDLDVVMRVASSLQRKKRCCFMVKNFQDVVQLPQARKIEGTIRSYGQLHVNASWLFMGTRAMLPAFVCQRRPLWHSGFVLIEEDITIAQGDGRTVR